MMKRGSAAATALVVLIASAPLTAQAIQRSLHVSVVDQTGNAVPDLGPSDFVVREDKASREVLRVAVADDPLQIAVLVDDSQAASDFIVDYREALKTFITAITGETAVNGKHSIAIVTLASRPTINTNYTSDAAELLKGSQRLFPQTDSATCLLDGIAEISKGMIKRHATRPVIVAITSEGPEVSNLSYLEVLDSLSEAGATLYVVAVGQMSKILPARQDRERVITEGTRNSGGRLDNIFTSRALTGNLKQVAYNLTHEYLVTYAHPDSLIPPDKVTVSAARDELTARGTLVRDAIEERK